MKKNIRQIKQELANFSSLRKKNTVAERSEFARRRRKPSKPTSPLNPRGEGVSLQDKCEIINRNLFGENTDAWLSPEELRKHIDELGRQLGKMSDEDLLSYGDAIDYMVECSNLIDVINFLTDRDRYIESGRTLPESLAVYKASKSLGDFFNTNLYKGKRQFLKAIRDGDTSLALKILHGGLDPNAKTQTGVTGLMCAAENGNLSVIEALIDAGADVNAKDEYGETAIFYAKTPSVAQYLIDNGADLTIKSNGGTAPSDALYYNAKFKLAGILVEFYEAGDPNTFGDLFIRTFTPKQIASKFLAEQYESDLEMLRWQFDRCAGDDWNLSDFRPFVDIASRWSKITDLNPALPKGDSSYMELLALFYVVCRELRHVILEGKDPKKVLPSR